LTTPEKLKLLITFGFRELINSIGKCTPLKTFTAAELTKVHFEFI